MIVNGGLGPTVDDLSQEVAAEACGVPLVLSDYWMKRMEESYARRGRVMPPNNRKQAMLPRDAEFIDNPIGTACGFAVTIGKARFFFTPPAAFSFAMSAAVIDLSLICAPVMRLVAVAEIVEDKRVTPTIVTITIPRDICMSPACLLDIDHG